MAIDTTEARRRVRILAAESLGVRGLAVRIDGAEGSVLIDPSFSLVPRRFNRPPHPFEVAAAWRCRQRLDEARRRSITIVLSHYHYDHLIPPEHRPLEFCTRELRGRFYQARRLLVRNASGQINTSQRRRARQLLDEFPGAEQVDGQRFGTLEFSPPVPHGQPGSSQGYVMLCTAGYDGVRVGYGSDTQCLNDEVVEWFAGRAIDVLIISGPPLYHPQVGEQIKREGLARLERLAEGVPLLVVDHHMARAPNCEQVLDGLSQKCGRQVFCAATWNGEPIRLLEAARKHLHRRWPVDHEWYGAVERAEDQAMRHVRQTARRLDDLGFARPDGWE